MKKQNLNLAEAKVLNLGLSYANVMGLNVAISDIDRLLKITQNVLENKVQKGPKYGPFFIVTLNPEILVKALENDTFFKVLKSADLVIADGNGLKFADSRLQIVPGRVLVSYLLKLNKKVFYLGGKDGVAKEMAKTFGGEADSGSENIQTDLQRGEDVRNDALLKKINTYSPDLLLVAYGAPWQELWINRNLEKIKAKVVIGVGGTFDYLTGRSKMAPTFVIKLRLEWLWRLINEPWRIKRQIRGAKFFWYVIRKKIGL